MSAIVASTYRKREGGWGRQRSFEIRFRRIRLVHVHDDSAHVATRRCHRDVFVGQGHALPLGYNFRGVSPGGGKTCGSAYGHGITGRRWPEAAASDVRRRRRRFYAGKTNGSLDGRTRRTHTQRTRRAREPSLQYRLIPESHVAVNVIVVRIVVERFQQTVADQHGSGPVTAVTGDFEPVATVIVAVAVLAFSARVPGLTREHDG